MIKKNKLQSKEARRPRRRCMMSMTTEQCILQYKAKHHHYELRWCREREAKVVSPHNCMALIILCGTIQISNIISWAWARLRISALQENDEKVEKLNGLLNGQFCKAVVSSFSFFSLRFNVFASHKVMLLKKNDIIWKITKWKCKCGIGLQGSFSALTKVVVCNELQRIHNLMHYIILLLYWCSSFKHITVSHNT